MALSLATSFNAAAAQDINPDLNCKTTAGREVLFEGFKKDAIEQGRIKQIESEIERASTFPGVELMTVDEWLYEGVQNFCRYSLDMGVAAPSIALQSWTQDLSAKPNYPDWMLKRRFGCDVLWNQDCKYEQLIKVSDLIPGGAQWQVCKFTYKTKTKRGDSGQKVELAGLVPDEQLRTARHTDILILVHASGSHKTVDRGAAMILSELHVWAVPLDMTDDERAARGCEVPGRSPKSKQPAS
ncbi:MAG: hypothetical protein EPO02_00945 [Nitrospirae bacterium]|nr:MAG: hypothetical protein EPO02_00945 [Nitrospirota bacterium]